MIRCGSSGSLVMIRSPFELYDNDQVVLTEDLSKEALAEITALVLPAEWHSFGMAQ